MNKKNTPNTFRVIKFSLFFLTIVSFIVFSGGYNLEYVLANDYLSNESFTGGVSSWSLTNVSYDSTYYQDSAGSLSIVTLLGRNKTIIGFAEQTIGIDINSTDTVSLGLYWSKQCVLLNCVTNNISVDIAKPSNPLVWVTVWSNSSIPSVGSPTSWANVSSEVSSFFDETGQYKIRIYADLQNGNDKNAQSLAWFDNLSLNVVPVPAISVSVSDGVVSYGTLMAGGSKNTLATGVNDMQTATNNGDVLENFNIKGQNTSCPWTLSATAGSDQYIHRFCNDTDNDCTTPPTSYTALTTSYQTLDTVVAASGTVDFQLEITVPNPSSCFSEQSVDVTIQAVQAL